VTTNIKPWILGKNVADAEETAKALGYSRDEYNIVSASSIANELAGVRTVHEVIETEDARLGRNYETACWHLDRRAADDGFKWRKVGDGIEYDESGAWIKTRTPQAAEQPAHRVTATLRKLSYAENAGPDLDRLGAELAWLADKHESPIVRRSAELLSLALGQALVDAELDEAVSA